MEWTHRTEHDGERGLVREVLSSSNSLARVLGQKLQVSSTTLETLLHLDLVLNDQRLSLRKHINRLVEYGRDGVVGGLRLWSMAKVEFSLASSIETTKESD